MEALPFDPRLLSMLRLCQCILPVAVRWPHGFTSVVSTELMRPAIYPLKWLLIYSELCSQLCHLIPRHFLQSPAVPLLI